MQNVYLYLLMIASLTGACRPAIDDNGLSSDVSSSELADDSVTTAKIKDGAVTPAKLSQAYLPLAGGTLSGALVLSADPSAALGAVTKQYADGYLGGQVISGVSSVTNGQVLAWNSTTSKWEPSTVAGGGAATSIITKSIDTVAPTTTGQTLTYNSGTGKWEVGTVSGNYISGGTFGAVNGSALTALNASNLGSGTVPAAQMPALTGDITTTAGAVATSIGTGKVTSTHILDGTIAPGDLASDSVTTVKILDANVTPAKLSAGAPGASGLVLTSTGATTAAWASREPYGYLSGLGLSNNAGDATNDIDIAAGQATDSTNAVRLLLTSAVTKRLDATWVTGTGQGGRSSSLALSDATWHVFLIRVAGVDDVGFDTSVTAANLITDHSATYIRRIGSIIRSGNTILAFIQDGDEFSFVNPVSDLSDGTMFTAAAYSRTLTVPTGIRVKAKILVNVHNSGDAVTPWSLWTDLATNDAAPGQSYSHTIRAAATSGGYAKDPVAFLQVWTNTSAQIRSRISDANDGNITVTAYTFGWFDSRGR